MPTNLTISAWVKKSNYTGEQVILGDCNAGETVFWDFEIWNKKLTFVWTTNIASAYRTYQTDNDVISDTNWHFVVVTQTGTSAPTIYVDGSSVNVSLLYTAGADTKPSAQGSAIGVRGLSGVHFYTGSIDEVGIWSRALTSGEVTILWNGGAGLAYPLTTNIDIAVPCATLSLSALTPTPQVSILVALATMTMNALGIIVRAIGWKNQVKHSAGTISNQTKHTVTPSNQTKHSAINVTNKTKSI
jgi:hypothetical protein